MPSTKKTQERTSKSKVFDTRLKRLLSGAAKDLVADKESSRREASLFWAAVFGDEALSESLQQDFIVQLCDNVKPILLETHAVRKQRALNDFLTWIEGVKRIEG